MLTARSILSFIATATATQCSAALPTIATTITPMKNSDRPRLCEAAARDPTRISDTAKDIGLSEFFIGAIVVAIVGNAAEHWVAVLVAAKDKMDLAVNIAIGSSAQIALFVAPVLVLVSFVLGPNPMPLVFNGFEVGAILLAVIIANQVTNEGESTWYEGLQLLAVYLVLALAFFFATR